MTPEPTCPDCRAPRPADAPRGLCPRCLMGAALSRPSAHGPAGEAGPTLTLTRPGSSDSTAGALAALAESLGGIPRVLLRDTDGPPGPEAMVRSASPEIPAPAGRAAHLQLFGEIARGGMGAVLKGRDVDLGRDLAVKVLLEKHRGNPDLIRRFVEEAQIAGQLQHPGVVPVYELGAFADRRPYFAMKLVKGRTLAAVLANRARPGDDAMGLLATMLRVGQTVAYAHARGVIHRDLKPSNVMLGGFGEVQVMDWGLAKILSRGGAADDARAGRDGGGDAVISTARSGSDSDLSRAGSVLGTPAYMAPEQARGEVEAVDERADVFALGSILCEVLTGRPAFTGRSSADIHRRAARGDLADAFARLDGCGADAELAALARDCLAPERDDRPRDASAFADRLGGYLALIERRLRAAELERAAEAARAEEAQARAAVERSRRRRTMALAASLLALTTLGGLTLAYANQRHQARLAAAGRDLRGLEILRDRARNRAEDPAGWQDAVAALRPIDADSLPAQARLRFTALAEEIRAGAAAAQADQELMARLNDIRSTGAETAAGRSRMATYHAPDGSASDAAYATAFRDARLDVDALGPEAAGAAIRGRPETVARELAAALDDWASQRRRARPNDVNAWRRLVAAARIADPDPRRAELRGLWERPDRNAQLVPLRAMARAADVDAWPAPTTNMLAGALAGAGDVEAAVALLRRAVGRHAGDAATNYKLARLLEQSVPPRRDEAIRYYTAARALRPETAHALADAVMERDGDKTDEAILILQELNRLQPGESRHLICLKWALGRRGRPDEARAASDAAVAAARAAARRNPRDANAHVDLGLALLANGPPGRIVGEHYPWYEEVVAELREAVRLQPDFAWARFQLGMALENDGRTDQAVAELRESVRLQPDLGTAHTYLGMIFRRQGKPGESLTAFREAARCDPHDSWSQSNLGEALFFQGEYDQAIASFREAARLVRALVGAQDRTEPGLHYSIALALLRQGKPDDAIAEYREALRLDPDHPVPWVGAFKPIDVGPLGPQGDPGYLDRAITAYRAAIRLRPDYPELHIIVGHALIIRREFDEAVAEFRAAIRLRPDLVLAHKHLIGALQAQGKGDERVAALREAIRLRPEEAGFRASLGQDLRDLGRDDEAVAAYREAVRIRPDDAMNHIQLGFALEALERSAEALAELRAGHELGSKQAGWSSPSADWVRQAEQRAALLDRLPALLRGEDHPKDNAERLALARLCSSKKRHAAAARFWGEALQADPGLGDDLWASHRYNAARAAALAGCGQGRDDPPPDEPARARLRGEALGWLQAELTLRKQRKAVLRDIQPNGGMFRQAVPRWKSDRDLAGVRDPDALARLPEAERAGWRALWAEADRLLEEARKTP